MTWRFWLAVAVAGTWAQVAGALPLQTIGTFCSTFPSQCQKGTESLLAARGTGTDAYYVLEVDPTTGAIPISGSVVFTATSLPIPSGTYADSARNVYSSVNVTTGAWVQLIASTAAAAKCVLLFDSSGQTLELGTGAVASETRKLIITPGGPDVCVPLTIPASTRVSVRAVSATASVGEIDLTLIN